MRKHGVFSIGKDAKSALKAAIMCEDAAKSTFLAHQLGTPSPIEKKYVDSLFDRYQNVYGKKL